MLDVLILGSGPAGATCARLLGQTTSLKVALIDARSFDLDDKAKKSCGGLLSSHAQHELKKQGLILPDHIKVEPQLRMVSTYDFINGLHRFYPRSYINMDRSLFERWLIDLIPKRVDIHFQTRVTCIEKIPEGFRLTLLHHQEKTILEGKILVGADGADSMVRRELCSDRPFPLRYVSIQHRYSSKSTHDAYYGFFDERITDYYSWALQKKDELLVGSALRIDGLVHEKFDKLIRSVKAKTDLDFSKPTCVEGAIILRPLSLKQLCFVQGKTAFIGEASGCISPTSAEGFSYALKSGRLLAQSLARYKGSPKALKAYDGSCFTLRLSILFKLLKYPGMYHPVLRKWVMLSSITAKNPKKGV